MLDHWDNLDGTVERGYAGASLWDWQTLPDYLDPRYTDYARANASLGINGTVLNNVNANAASLTARVPREGGGARRRLPAVRHPRLPHGPLQRADRDRRPADRRPARSRRARVVGARRSTRSTAAIPDFGGFLVKANSEGQPGPQDYGRTPRRRRQHAGRRAGPARRHRDVARLRLLAASARRPRQAGLRRVHAARRQVPRQRACVQVKNGPIDFQPREPFHPLFGAMPKTPLMLEFQITKEYLGLRHPPRLPRRRCWRRCCDADTHARARLDGRQGRRRRARRLQAHRHGRRGQHRQPTATGAGSQFDQANWYAFGRLAWDPDARRARDRRRMGCA